MRVGIVGGGIAGLALAGLLEQHGVEYTVLEQASAWSRVGYGVGLWSSSLQVLHKLDILEQVYACGTGLDALTIRGAEGRHIGTFTVQKADGPVLLAIHRDDLHAELREVVPEERVLLDSPVDAVSEAEGSVTVEVAAGADHEFDLLVGADGFRSTVREQCFDTDPVPERDTNVWSFWVPESVNVPETLTSIWKPGITVAAVTVNGRGLVNVFARGSETSAPGSLEVVAQELGWIIPDAVNAADDAAVFHDQVASIRNFDWGHGRVVLLGDAAHALNPISASGASLALQDAASLSACIVSQNSPESAIRGYKAERMPAVRSMQRKTRVLERIMFGDVPGLEPVMYGVLAAGHPAVEWYVNRRFGKTAVNPRSEGLDGGN